MKRFTVLGFVMLGLCPNLWAGAITSATVYPVGATVALVEDAAAGTVAVRLPNGSDPTSLMLKLSDERFKILDVSLNRVSRETSPEIVKLKARIVDAKAARQQTAAALEACEAEQLFWKGSLDRAWPTAAEALKLNEAARVNLPRLIKQRQNLSARLAELDKTLKDLQQELDQLGGDVEQDWAIQVQISGPQAVRTRLNLSCFVSQCGYEPSYRLNALPGKGQIEFGYEAKVWQKTGFDWNDVRLTLATVRPGTAINPPELDAWYVRVRENFVRAGRMSPKVMSMAAPVAAELDEAAENMVVEEQRGTYTEWQLGSVSLPTGPGRLMKISGEIWPAEFVYRVRPAQGPLGFLEAQVKLAEGRQLPRGEALYLVDGAMVGRLPFDLADREQTLYFGSDSLIRCERKLLDHKTGSSGLVKTNQTYTWHYELKLSNMRRTAVRVLLEEAKPQARDERIRVELKATPGFTVQDERQGTWDLTLAPQTTRKLDYAIRLESSLDIEPGR